MKEIVGFLLIGCVMLSGCTGNSNPVANGTAPAKQTAWLGIVFANPIKNTINVNAVKTAGIIGAINMAATAPWLAAFDTIAPETFKNTVQWTLVTGSLTQTLTKAPSGDTAANCLVIYNGTDMGGMSFDNFPVYATAFRNDGKSGSWTNYLRYQSFTFAIDANGTKTGDWLPDGTGTSTSIADSTNGNGSLVTYIPGPTAPQVSYVAQWLADGSGTWASFGSNGVQTGSGIWGK